MHIEKFTTWALALGAAAILSASYLLDGPSEADLARAQAADLADAQRTAKLSAQRFERDLRACKKALGPTADLIEIAGSDGDYVCREQAIEPTPAAILSRYADLAGRKP